jgi:CBS domain-containing protein
MDVEDLMTRAVHTCRRDEALHAVAQLMWEHDVGALPVLDAQGRAVGMISDRDICMAAYTQGQPLSALRVQRSMSRALHVCHPKDRVSAAERTMRVHGVRRLPVVDDHGELIGILTLSDIVRARIKPPTGKAAQKLLMDVAFTLAEICRPRSAASAQPETEVAPVKRRAPRSRKAAVRDDAMDAGTARSTLGQSERAKLAFGSVPQNIMSIT